MGIKSGFNNIEKIFVGSTPVKEVYYGTNLIFSSDADRGNLALWRYSNDVIPNKTVLFEYLGDDWTNTLYVPMCRGNSILNSWIDDSSVEPNRNTPFYNNSDVRNVDVQGVPLSNTAEKFFGSCTSLRDVSNLNFYSIKKLDNTFRACSKFNRRVRIPTSVTSMNSTFIRCSYLNQNFSIPSGVLNATYTFQECKNMSNAWINIFSANIENASGFYSSGVPFVWNYSPNCLIPMRYINNSYTDTYNAFKNAGWSIVGDGTIVRNSIIWDMDSIRGWDFILGDYNVYSGNNTHWILRKWNGALSSFLKYSENNLRVTDVKVPEYYTTYSTFPTALNKGCFYSNNVISSVDFGTRIPWESNTMYEAFLDCSNMKSIVGVVGTCNNARRSLQQMPYLTSMDVIFHEGITDMRAPYTNDYSMTDFPPMGSGVLNLRSCFYRCNGLINAPVISNSATQLYNLFYGCSNLRGNIYILSPNVTNIAQSVVGHNNSLRKRFYIYYRYNSNGNYTLTYNQFKKYSVFTGSSGSTPGTEPLFNSVSNMYVYDLSKRYNNLWNYVGDGAPTLRRITLRKYLGNDPHVAVMANYPDYTVRSVWANCFTEQKNIITLALYHTYLNCYDNYIPDVNGAVGIYQDLFRNCYNLRLVQGLKLNQGTAAGILINYLDISRAFENCYNLRVVDKIPSNVVNLAYTFANCKNLAFNIQIEDGVTNMAGTFYGCYTLDRNIKIPNTVTDISNIFYGCTNLSQNIRIPANVTNMKNSFYLCSNLTGTIDILSSNIADVNGCFTGSNLYKEVYIPTRYENGKRTLTFNSFKKAGYLDMYGISTGKDNTLFQVLVN
jgi:hypothetical protein